MSVAPKVVIARINAVLLAWTHLRPEKSFSGLTREQFQQAVQASIDTRAIITEADSRLQAASAQREKADEASMEAVKRVVRGVQGDPDEGEDGELYAAMGFVRKSQRSSGLTRRRKDENERGQEDVAAKEGTVA